MRFLTSASKNELDLLTDQAARHSRFDRSRRSEIRFLAARICLPYVSTFDAIKVFEQSESDRIANLLQVYHKQSCNKNIDSILSYTFNVCLIATGLFC